jgi:hypothetical protein
MHRQTRESQDSKVLDVSSESSHTWREHSSTSLIANLVILLDMSACVFSSMNSIPAMDTRLIGSSQGQPNPVWQRKLRVQETDFIQSLAVLVRKAGKGMTATDVNLANGSEVWTTTVGFGPMSSINDLSVTSVTGVVLFAGPDVVALAEDSGRLETIRWKCGIPIALNAIAPHGQSERDQAHGAR